MKYKVVTGIMLALFLVGVLTLAFNVQVVAAVDWWPMRGHDLSHTGYSTSTAPNTNNTIWIYTTGDDVHSSPAVVDGRVYVGSDNNNVYCLNAYTGARMWSYKTGGMVESSPAVADGRVYVGSDDNNTYCLDAWTGAKIWNYKAGHCVASSPAVVDGKVYVGSEDGKVYAFESPSSVGGIWIPVDKFGLLAPYIGLASTILVATAAKAIYVKRVNRRKKKQ